MGGAIRLGFVLLIALDSSAIKLSAPTDEADERRACRLMNDPRATLSKRVSACACVSGNNKRPLHTRPSSRPALAAKIADNASLLSVLTRLSQWQS
ncbi:Hypothetical predicted protein [Cloeon dipterum]|uniref:Secreted protein n=1 Tax=Cloeon dipterum TaxID=197152 RepID=A0A8S1D9F6_9INSE|nr:Hypothetical predicted protein [Cloeon dipterum]